MEIKINNPFVVAITIVIVLYIIFYILLKPKAKYKMHFRTIFYSWILATGILYFHHKTLTEEYTKKIDDVMGVKLINSSIDESQMLKPEITGNKEEAINIFATEDMLI